MRPVKLTFSTPVKGTGPSPAASLMKPAVPRYTTPSSQSLREKPLMRRPDTTERARAHRSCLSATGVPNRHACSTMPANQTQLKFTETGHSGTMALSAAVFIIMAIIKQHLRSHTLSDSIAHGLHFKLAIFCAALLFVILVYLCLQPLLHAMLTPQAKTMARSESPGARLFGRLDKLIGKLGHLWLSDGPIPAGSGI